MKNTNIFEYAIHNWSYPRGGNNKLGFELYCCAPRARGMRIKSLLPYCRLTAEIAGLAVECDKLCVYCVYKSVQESAQWGMLMYDTILGRTRGGTSELEQNWEAKFPN